MEDIAQRLKKLIEDLELNPSSFADEIRVQRSGISHILSGRNKPSLDFFEKLLRRYPKTDLVWLITGRNALFNSDQTNMEFKITEDSVEKEDNLQTESSTKKVIILKENGRFEEYSPENNNSVNPS